MSAMGINTPQLDFPVCNKFRPKIRKGQLCYQVDVNDLDEKHDMVLGLTFIMDYNDEKMTGIVNGDTRDNLSGLYDMQDEEEKAVSAMIYIETLGKLCLVTVCLILILQFRAASTVWSWNLCAYSSKRSYWHRLIP